MTKNPRKSLVFIGSARESEEDARDIAACIEKWNRRRKADVVVHVWNKAGLFVPNQNVWDQLYTKVRNDYQAAILIFGPNDQVWFRGKEFTQARDNVLLEYGLFTGGLGPRRVAFCTTANEVKIPSDVDGLIYIDFSETSRNTAEISIEVWLDKIFKKQIKTHSNSIKNGRVENPTPLAESFSQRLARSSDADLNKGSDFLTDSILEEILAVIKKGEYPELRGRITRLKIKKNGDGWCSTQESICKPNQKIHVVPFTMAGDHPVPTLKDLKVNVESLTNGHKITLHKGEDGPTKKMVILRFDPPIAPGKVVRYRVSWTWPKMWVKLIKGKADNWRQPGQSSSRIPEIRTEIQLHPSIGRLKLENRGKGGGGLDKSVKKRNNYAWLIKNMKPGLSADIWLVPQGK